VLRLADKFESVDEVSELPASCSGGALLEATEYAPEAVLVVMNEQSAPALMGNGRWGRTVTERPFGGVADRFRFDGRSSQMSCFIGRRPAVDRETCFHVSKVDAACGCSSAPRCHD